MTENSKREQIIQYWVNKFEVGETVQARRWVKVMRLLPELNDLGNFTNRMLPLLAIVAKLPKPTGHRKGMGPGGSDIFISDLQIDFVTYAMNNTTPDSLVSDLADDLWAVLYSDPTSGAKPNSLTTALVISPEPAVVYLSPYIIFKMVCNFSYVHTTGGI